MLPAADDIEAKRFDVTRALLKKAGDLGLLPRSTPSQVRRIVERCLEKDPRRRARDIAVPATLLATGRTRMLGPAVRAGKPRESEGGNRRLAM